MNSYWIQNQLGVSVFMIHVKNGGLYGSVESRGALEVGFLSSTFLQTCIWEQSIR